MKDLTKIHNKGTSLIRDHDRLLFIVWTDTVKNFFSYDHNHGLQSVDEIEYCKVIGGDQYEQIQKQLGSPLHDYASTIGMNGDRYFCTYQNDIIHGFDRNGIKKLEWQPEVGMGHPIYDIKFHPPNSMWLAFPTGQTVTKVSLTTKEEEYRIGEYTYDEIYEPLSYPESLFVTDKHLFIPNMGNNKLFRLDLATNELELIHTFDDRLWQYLEIGNNKYVNLDNGLFEWKINGY